MFSLHSKLRSVCCALVLALASSSTLAQDVGVPLELPSVTEDSAQANDVDTDRIPPKATEDEEAKSTPDTDASVVRKKAGLRKDKALRASASPRRRRPRVKPKTAMEATVVPGLIGLSLGAALPATLAAAGLATLVWIFVSSDPTGVGPEAGFYLYVGAFASMALGAAGMGPLSAVGSVSGIWIGANINKRSMFPGIVGAGAGVVVLGLSIFAFAASQGSLIGSVPGVVLLLLTGPVAFAVAATYDLAANDGPPPRPTITRHSLDNFFAAETEVAMPVRY